MAAENWILHYALTSKQCKLGIMYRDALIAHFTLEISLFIVSGVHFKKYKSIFEPNLLLKSMTKIVLS